VSREGSTARVPARSLIACSLGLVGLLVPAVALAAGSRPVRAVEHLAVDSDHDGIPDDVDRCLGYSDFRDADGDGIPNGCDFCAGHDDAVDSDGDGVADGCDICPGGNDDLDADEDGIPDGCDRCADFPDTLDADADGMPDRCDVCAGFDDAVDADADGVPDGCDACPAGDDGPDSDEDGIADACDACPGFDDGRADLEDLVICMFGDTFSVRIRDVPLDVVLAELETKLPLHAELSPGSATRPIRVDFDHLPFDQGVRRILLGQSFVLRMRPGGVRASDATVEQPSGPIAHLQVLEPEVAAPLPRPASASDDSSTVTVARSRDDLEVLMARADEASSSDERRLAIVSLLETAKAADEPALRAAALAFLTDIEHGSEARRAVERGLRDGSQEVRQVAARALRDFPPRD